MKTKKEILREQGYQPVIGRPSVGDTMLSPLTIPVEIKKALDIIKKKYKKSLPEMRRQILLEYLQKENML